MKATCTIDDALADSNLLGAALGEIESWKAWRTILKAAFGIKLNSSERKTFAKLSGGRKPPRKRVAELWVIAGRRSGKSRMAALVSSYLAAFEDHTAKMSPGETGHVLCLSPSKSQARSVRDYAGGFFDSSPMLRKLVLSETSEGIRLRGNISIGVHTNSFRTVRGRSLIAAVLEEVAFMRDETSAAPDIELYRAIIPALASTNGMLIGISSPYRRLGLLHQKHRDYYAVDDDDVLVIQAPTTELNPTINAKVIDRARRSDPEAARAEWDAEFRSDLSSLLDDDLIDAAIDNERPIELPPRAGIRYLAFTDASAGRHDAFTLCIGHMEGQQFVADLIRGRTPPFDPNDVAKEYAALAKQYGCNRVTGDNYSGEWVVTSFKATGMGYDRSLLTKSSLYLEMLPMFMREAIFIPEIPILVRELRLLERRVSRSGRDSVDHGQGGSDDYANVLAGAAWLALGKTASTTRSVEFSI